MSLSDTLHQQLLLDFEEGIAVPLIAEKYGITRQTVYNRTEGYEVRAGTPTRFYEKLLHLTKIGKLPYFFHLDHLYYTTGYSQGAIRMKLDELLLGNKIDYYAGKYWLT